MAGIVRWVLSFRLVVLGAAAALLAFWAVQLRDAPLEVLPEFTPTYVEVQTEALGLSAEEVEQLITVPLEADLLSGLAWLETIESTSVTGLSSIVLTFEPGTDVFRARQMVAERLTQAHALPNVSKPPQMIQPLASASRVMMVGLSSDELSLIDLSVLARWNIRPRLMGVPGVANVAIWGQRERQLQVLVDPAELHERGVSLRQVVDTTGNALWFSPLTFLEASTPGTGGFIDTPNQRLGVQHILPIRSAEDLAQVILEPNPAADAEPNGLRLGDVADVVEDHQPLIGDAVVGGRPGLLLVLEKFPGVNTLQVTRDIEAALEAMKPGLQGVEIDSTIFRPATFIEEAIGNISLALLIGFVLAAVVLIALLHDWRAALLSLVAIPLSLAAAVLVLRVAGATFNVMILAGLVAAVGVIVDDAVTGAHAVVRRLRKPRRGDSRTSGLAIVLEATLEARRGLGFATLIILATLVPALFAAGVPSAFLPPLAIAYGLAVVTSLLVATLVTPAFALVLTAIGGAPREKSRLIGPVRDAYDAVLARLVRQPRPAFLAALTIAVGVAAVFAVAMVPRFGQASLPSFRERDLLIDVQATPGTSLPAMTQLVTAAVEELRGIPGVSNVGAHMGRAILSDKVASIDSGQVWVSIDQAADYDATVGAIEAALDRYAALSRSPTDYDTARVAEVLAPDPGDVVVRVYGQDQASLDAKAEEVRLALTGVDGLTDPQVVQALAHPAIEIEVDLAAAERHGLKAGDIRRDAATLLSGIEVGALFEDQKVFEVVVWGAPELRASPESVGDLLIETPAGRLVPLAELADVRVATSPIEIRREGVMRYVDVTANVAGRAVGAVLADVEGAIGAIEFPLESHAEILPFAAQEQDAQTRLLTIAVAVALAVLLLLQAAFASWALAALVFVALPASLVGSMAVAFALGDGLSIGSLAGFLAVLALAVRNAVTLVDRALVLERRSRERDRTSAVLRVMHERLTPILLTTVTTALAVGPIVVLGNAAGFEMLRPMALVILGGLVSTTLVSIFLIPLIYLRLGPRPEPDIATELLEQPALTPTAA